MLNSYIYIFVEMLMIMLGIYSLYSAKRHSPSKIKAVAVIVIILMLLRFVSNIILFASRNILFLYILKFFALINIATIPITAILCIYIFIRSDDISFDYVFILGTILLVAYSVAVFNTDYYIQRTVDFGYLIAFRHWVYIELIFIAVISIILITAMVVIGRKVSNNTGLLFIIIAAVITIGEIVMKIFELQVMPNLMFADFSWMMVMLYALSTIKIKKGR